LANLFIVHLRRKDLPEQCFTHRQKSTKDQKFTDAEIFDGKIEKLEPEIKK